MSPQEQLAEYLRLYPESSESSFHYHIWCGERYMLFINEKLKEHNKRNEDYLISIDGVEAYEWMIKTLNEKPQSMQRGIDDAIFDKILGCMGIYNSLSMELSRDVLDEETVTYFINRIKTIKISCHE